MTIKLVFDNVGELKELLNQLLQDNEEAGAGIISIPKDPLADENVETKQIHLMFEDEPVITVTPNFEKILNYGKYRYDINKCYFKTQQGRSGRILITGNEALTIIPMIQEGMTDKQIYNAMIQEHNGFLHDKGTLKGTATINTIGTFRRMYNQMELNNALRFYCNNSRVKENAMEYVKFPALDEDDLEVEDLWH